MHRLSRWLFGFLFTFFTGVATGHESRPLLVEITERAPSTFSVQWKIPSSAAKVALPRVVMPQTCEPLGSGTGSGLVQQQLFKCSRDLSGQEIRVDFPDYNPSISLMFRMFRLSGENHMAVKGPNEPFWQVPDKESVASVAGQYTVLGIEHILFGYDHLLFVACLVFIAGSWRRILITITGFTISHSVTLALAALDVVRVPVPPVEAVIALSIVFLAVEIARGSRDTITWRFPIAVSASFGLLHGFGFASALSEIGLPQTEIPAALLFFNVGVEIGQVLFVVLLLALMLMLQAIQNRSFRLPDTAINRWLAPQTVSLIAYVTGAIAAYWTIDRMVSFV